MYKIIFADIDGTLRNSKREITQRTKDDIKKLMNKGIQVILCSGRTRYEVERVSRECGASKYIISSNGAEVYNYIAKKVEYKNMVNIEAIKKAYDIAERYDCLFIMNSRNIKFINKMKDKDEIKIVPSDGIINAAYDNDIMQCVITNNDIETIKKVKAEVQKIPQVKIINESRCLNDKKIKCEGNVSIDVVDEETSKGNAVKIICELLNTKKEETTGIGDSYNDFELLDNVGFSVAMGNSIRGLKSKVDYVTNTNDLDGAAEFFEKILEEQI